MSKTKHSDDSILLPMEMAPWDIMQKICEQLASLKPGEALSVGFQKKRKKSEKKKPTETGLPEQIER